MASQASGDAQMTQAAVAETPEMLQAKRLRSGERKGESKGQSKGDRQAQRLVSSLHLQPATRAAAQTSQVSLTVAKLEEIRQLLAHLDQRTSSVEERVMFSVKGFQDHECLRWSQRAVRLPD